MQRIPENELLISKYNLLTIFQEIHKMQLHLPIIFYRLSDTKLLKSRKLEVGQVNSILCSK